MSWTDILLALSLGVEFVLWVLAVAPLFVAIMGLVNRDHYPERWVLVLLGYSIFILAVMRGLETKRALGL